MSKLRVLVTGPGGRLGPHLLPAFREAYEVRLLDRRPLPGEPDTVVTDLQDIDALRSAMQDIDVVVHLAATSDEAPFVESLAPNNVVGLYNVFQAAKEAGVRRIVFASTAQSVAGYPYEHIVEIEDPIRPITMYAATKVFGEAMGRYYHDKHGLEFVGLRIGWFQPYDSEAVRHNPDCRDIWLSPRDAARLFRCAIDKPDVGYAIAFGVSITPRGRLSLTSARELLGYEPQDVAEDYKAK